MRWRLDGTWSRVGSDRRIVVGGSPFRLFRVTDAGARVADRIEAGECDESTFTARLVDAGAIHPVPDSSTSFTTSDVTIVTPQLGGKVVHDGRVTVDDASEPSLVDATVRLDVNRGPAGARNAGRRLAGTELIAFVDADVDVPVSSTRLTDDAEWWALLLAHFDDPRVGLVAPRVTGDDGSSLDLGPEPARVRAGTRVSYVPGAMMIVRASAFDDVGGFDEMLRSGEDVDFVWRLDQAGWRCRYEPRRSVHHRPRPTFVGRLRQQVNYGASSGPLALRHPRALAPYRSNGWTAGSWALVTLGHPVVALVAAAGACVALVGKIPDVDRRRVLWMAASGHLSTGGQAATAVRRVWWPIVAVAAPVSRRARLVGAVSIALGPKHLPIDLAFGWGTWRSMIRHRTLRPILPHITIGSRR